MFLENVLGILIPLILIVFACLITWRACDGFEIASEYIGRNLSEGVRGGTINAISSSIPELFTALIALFVLSDRDGFAIGIGTTAGSALFNGMIIPAACILTVIGTVIGGVRVTSVNVSTRVLLRDGLALIACEFVLILLINGNALHWWQGLILMGLYFAYFSYMLFSMSSPKSDDDSSLPQSFLDEEDGGETSRIGRLVYWASLGPLVDLERYFVRERHRRQIETENWNGWPLLLTSTAIIGAACWLLVQACEWLGTGNAEHPSYELFGQEFVGLGMPPMFVAVIFASMATSVPDTVMSIRDARDGDYDDAVANALGSNIFDICFALGFPLFLYTLIHGPINMSPDVTSQSGQLRLLLLSLTILGFLVYYVGRRQVNADGVHVVEMRKGKAVVLLGLYLVFVLYVVALGANHPLALQLSGTLDQLLGWLPRIG
ncbi:sodium:calcium antiporter [Roseiconus nitratireducens]|uniref:Sodium:calcium antiporter n=1 Tax=Roseiconus nitratireducens TaxID=2605748 RepID=A0A5M6CZK8_9BACT|nr:sodium:calcium antiporter [Roseiconus nitratireducens]KAA5539462.1 sodium:calcium antiporter [Roseiconus nitratireducens]